MEILLEAYILFKMLILNPQFVDTISSKLDYATVIQLAPLEDELRMMGYVIVTNSGEVIVVDGGLYTDGPKLEKYINQYGGKVDSWYITHYHTDHASALGYIVNETDIEINNIYHSLPSREKVVDRENERIEDYDKYVSIITNEKIKNKVHEAYVGQIIDVGNVKAEILGTKEEEIVNNFGNNQSMVIKMYIGNSSILFLGDTGVEKESILLDTVYDKLKSDYVQVSHHGQRGASEKFYQVVSPKYAFFPCSTKLYNNDLGDGFNTGWLKTIETRRWLEKIGTINYVAGSKDIKLQIK